MKKHLCALMLIVLLSVSIAVPAGAFSADTHDKHLKTALFGENGFSLLDDQGIEFFEALTHASYLCIDQFKGDGQDKHLNPLLDLLKDYPWRFLPAHSHYPKEISEINYTQFYHRIYTHLGWDDSHYKNRSGIPADWIDGKWKKRKNILRSTVEAIFDFNKWSLGIESEKGENFCRLIYYIHLLGDHIHFDAAKYKSGCRDIIPLAGRHPETRPYLIHELIEASKILFEGKDISQMEKELNEVNAKIIDILNHPELLATEEGFKESYHACAEKVLTVLSRHLPELLKDEEFFRKVFY